MSYHPLLNSYVFSLEWKFEVGAYACG